MQNLTHITWSGAGAGDAFEPPLEIGEDALARGDVSALIAADVAFHRTIYDRGQDARLRARTWREHREIAAAIGGGNADQAECLAVLHCRSAGETTADHLDTVETTKKMSEFAGRT